MTRAARDLDQIPSGALQVGAPSFPVQDSDFPFYTVGQVAQLLNVQPAFLRRLDSEDVVCPGRSEGGQRRYSQNDIGNVRRTVELVDEGMTLVGIRRLMVLETEVVQLRAELDAERTKSKNRGR